MISNHRIRGRVSQIHMLTSISHKFNLIFHLNSNIVTDQLNGEVINISEDLEATDQEVKGHTEERPRG